MTQQDKMKVCNTKAGDKKGDERKTFMSECLKVTRSPSGLPQRGCKFAPLGRPSAPSLLHGRSGGGCHWIDARSSG
jgi:hypothetical protein